MKKRMRQELKSNKLLKNCDQCFLICPKNKIILISIAIPHSINFKPHSSTSNTCMEYEAKNFLLFLLSFHVEP